MIKKNKPYYFMMISINLLGQINKYIALRIAAESNMFQRVRMDYHSEYHVQRMAADYLFLVLPSHDLVCENEHLMNATLTVGGKNKSRRCHPDVMIKNIPGKNGYKNGEYWAIIEIKTLIKNRTIPKNALELDLLKLAKYKAVHKNSVSLFCLILTLDKLGAANNMLKSFGLFIPKPPLTGYMSQNIVGISASNCRANIVSSVLEGDVLVISWSIELSESKRKNKYSYRFNMSPVQ